MHDCFFPSYQFTFNMEGKFLYTSVVICMIFWANISTCSFVCTLTSTSWCSCWLKASSRVLILRAFYTNSAKHLAKVCNRRHMGNLYDHVWSLHTGYNACVWCLFFKLHSCECRCLCLPHSWCQSTKCELGYSYFDGVYGTTVVYIGIYAWLNTVEVKVKERLRWKQRGAGICMVELSFISNKAAIRLLLLLYHSPSMQTLICVENISSEIVTTLCLFHPFTP